jgi:glyoxylase-like metal-dependent hydrolase (beta-lactamase superfamily II)
MPTPSPIIETYVLGPFETNCFVVRVEGAAAGADRAECWIVDCGFEPEPMLDAIDARNLRPTALLLTHAHPDHIAGVELARSRYRPLPVLLHEAERGFCSDPMLNLSAAIGMPVSCAEPERWLHGGETLELAGTRWRVLHAPGHSPGGVIYVNDASRQAIVGDTLFAGSVGRSDFPTSNPAALRRTLREVLMGLPDDVTIHPGHGPATTIGRERRTNPFVTGAW